MSWLGSGLSQITGQISNFTKEVLTEGTEEIDDHVTELRLAKSRVAELENQIHAQKNETEKLRAINSELLDKLESSELQISAISGEYRHKLQQSQEEVKQLKQKHNELLELQRKMPVSSAASSTVNYSSPASAASHHPTGLRSQADEHDFHDVISGQHEIYQLRLEVQRLNSERTHWRSLAEQSRSSSKENGGEGQEDPELLHQRIMELEQQLRNEVDSHQRELVALQDAHNQKLYTVKQQLKQQLQQQQQQNDERDGSSEKEVARLNEFVKELQETGKKLREEKDSLEKQMNDRLQGSPERTGANTQDGTDSNLARTLREGRLPSSTPMNPDSYSRRVVDKDESYSESLVLDFSEMSMQNESLSEQVQRLQQQVEDYEAEIKRFDDIKVDWESEKDALQGVLLQLRQKLQTKEEALKAKEKNKNSKEEEMPEAEESAEDADRSRVESLESDLSLKTAKLMEALERMEQQDAELEKLQQLLKEMEESQLNQTEDTSLQADLNLRGEQLKEALDKVKHSEEELNKLKHELEQKETELEEISIDKEAIEASLEELDAQHQEALQQVLSSRDSLVATNDELKQQMAALRENSVLLEEKAETSAISEEAIDKEIASLREQLEKEQSYQHEMKMKLNKAAHSLNELHMDKQELEKSNTSLNQKVGELSAKIKDITGEKAELIKSVQSLETSLNRTREELERSTLEAAPVGDLEFRVQESQERCDKLAETIDQLESQINSLGQERNQLTEELKNSSFSLMQSEGSNKDLTLRVSELSTQVEALTSEKTILQQDIVQIEQKMQDQRHHYESFIQQLKQSREMDESSLQHRVESLAKDCYDKDHKVSDLESVISGLRRELQEQKEVVQAALDGQVGVKDVLSDKESEISILQTESKSLNELLDERRCNIKTLEAEVERLKGIDTAHKSEDEESDKLHTEIVTLRKQVRSQKSQEENEAKDKRMLEVMTDLESDIASLKTTLEQQKTVISKRDAEVIKLKDTITLRDSHISDLNVKLQEHSSALQKIKDELESTKVSFDQKDKEISELKQKVQEVSTKKSDMMSNNNENDNNNADGVYIENGDIDGEMRNGAGYEVLQEELEQLRKIAAQKDSVITELRVNNSALLKMLEDKSLQLHGDKSLVEIHKLENEVRSLRREREQIMSILNEKSRECSNLKSEVHKLMNVVSAEKSAISKLQLDNNELMKKREDPNSDMTKETVKKLSQMIRDKDLEIESLTMKTQTLLQVLQDNSQEGTQLSTLMQEKDNLVKQVALFQADREQIIQALNQKHQESVAFHGEVQRLSELQNNSVQQLDNLKQQYANLKKQYEDKQQALLKVQNDLLNYKQKYSEIENKMKENEGKVKVIEVARQATPPSEELRQFPPPASVLPPAGISSGEQEQLGSMIRELRRTLAQKEEQCKEKDSLVVQNGIKLKAKEDLIHKKDALLTEKTQVINDMNVKLREVKESAREKEIELGAQKKKVDNLTFQLQGLQVEVHDLQAQNSNLSDERSNFQSQIVQMKEANNRLNVTVGERDLEVGALKEKIATLSQLLAAESTSTEEKGAVDQRMAETEAMQKQAQIFQQERDQAMTSLRAKQMDLQQLQHQYSQLTEREKKWEREVERLRNHLIQIEDGYTQEALAAEEREKDLRNRLAHAEERAHSQSSAVQNASAMAVQQLESLEKQLYEVTSQRDTALHQLAATQEQANQYATNLANLQMVLEQFTHEREQQLAVEIERYLQQLSSCKFERDQLRHQCRQLQVELDETKEALEAAHRLSEQLDRKEATISALRNEVQMREQELQKYEQELNCVKTTNEGKVDKALIKNLFLGYFHLPSGKRSEGIRLIGKVLSFNEEEMKQAGVDGVGWLTGVTGMFRKGLQVGPPKSPGSSPGTPSFDKSFSELFVNFLEQESTPTIAARLPMDQMIQEQQQKQQQKHHQPFNPFAPIPAGHAANSQTVPTPSGGGLVSLTGDPRESHLLMAPLTPSLPTFNPIIPSVTPSSGRGSAASSGRSTPASSSILRDVLQQS